MNTSKIFSLGATAVVAFSIANSDVLAGTEVNLPNVNIVTGDDGTVVDLPGVHINTKRSNGVQRINPNQEAKPSLRKTETRSGVLYNNAQLQGMDFSNKNLEGANFENSNLDGASFAGSVLNGADFSNASLKNVDFSGARLIGANCSNASFAGANLSNADLSGANLSNTRFRGAIIVNASFEGANLSNADLSRAIRRDEAAPRPQFVSAPQIVEALKTNPENPSERRKLDLTVNFDFDSDEITKDGMNQVKIIAEAISSEELRGAKILIEGHTDDVGKDEYNNGLSMRRATRIMKVLSEEYGIPMGRLLAQGFGESMPVADNSSDLGRALNRRVTLVNLGEAN